MKKTSIKDVAKAAGVSITTVSRALNGYTDVSARTKQKVLQIASQLNYAPDVNARSLGGIADTTIALLISDMQEIDDSGFVYGTISGLYHACQHYGCEFTLLATDTIKQQKINYLQLCRKKNIDGVVVMGLRTDDTYYEEVVNSEIPCTLIDIDIEGQYDNICTVSTDNMEAACTAVKHLMDKGHHEIGMLNGRMEATVSKQRFAGYAKAFLDRGALINLEYLRYSNFSRQQAFEDTKELLNKYPKITALFCASDLMAIGAISALEEMGKNVPEDISVIGFDDIAIASYIHGGITTIRQSPYEKGRLAGRAVYKMLKKEKGAEKIIAPYEFVERHTVRGIN